MRRLLTRFSSGACSLEEVLAELGAALVSPPRTKDLGFASVDLERRTRQGHSEVVFGEGKTPSQIVGIARSLFDAGQPVLVTRVSSDKAEVVCQEEPRLRFVSEAKILRSDPGETRSRARTVAVVAAGTSDLFVVEETAHSLEFFGADVERVVDVGVAGLHRLLSALPRLERADVAIVVAGMEGALPSVVGGLLSAPVVAVPTSVGYGAALGGLTPLLGMLTGCAAGTTVVNIDNGFGAAMAALRILDLADADR